MIVKVYPSPDGSTYCHAEKGAHGVRFVVMYKNSSRICLTADDVRRTFGVARNTEGVKALHQWALSIEAPQDNHDAPAEKVAPSSPDETEPPLPGPLI